MKYNRISGGSAFVTLFSQHILVTYPILPGTCCTYLHLKYNYLCNQWLSPLKLWVWIPLMMRCTRYNIMWKSLSVTCCRLVVFPVYSGFIHWPPRYSWNIVESGVKHHNHNPIFEKNYHNLRFFTIKLSVTRTGEINHFNTTVNDFNIQINRNHFH